MSQTSTGTDRGGRGQVLDLVQLAERFEHRALVPNAMALQQSRWRQRWELPLLPVHSASTNWSYYVDPGEIISELDPNEPLGKLRFALQHDTRGSKYFLTGTRGAGKSTAAHTLWQDPDIQQKFFLITCSVSDYLNPADLDASQVMAMMLAHLIEAARDIERDEKLAIPEAKAAMKELRKLLRDARPGLKLDGVNVNILGLAVASFKNSKRLREAYRTYAEGFSDELMSVFDELVVLFEKYCGKKLLFIIDDLDKIGAFDINRNVFHQQIPLLVRPSCAALYTYPLELHHDARFSRLKDQSNRFVLGNVKLHETARYESIVDDGRQVLRQFIERRLDSAPIERYFEPELLDKVFSYACGNFRELCRVLQGALRTAAMQGRDRADRACLEAALRDLRKDYNPILQRNRNTLHTVRANVGSDAPADLDAEKLAPLIQSLAVVEYPDDPGWLDVHPLIKDLMDGVRSVL